MLLSAVSPAGDLCHAGVKRSDAAPPLAGHRRKGSSFFSPFLHLFVCLFVSFFQHNSDQAAGDRGRDCESGHLTYRSGDVLEERCRFSSVAVD